MTAKAGWPKGKRLSEEHRRKLSEAMRGRKHSDETKRRMKLGQRRYYLSMPVDELENEITAR